MSRVHLLEFRRDVLEHHIAVPSDALCRSPELNEARQVGRPVGEYIRIRLFHLLHERLDVLYRQRVCENAYVVGAQGGKTHDVQFLLR